VAGVRGKKERERRRSIFIIPTPNVLALLSHPSNPSSCYLLSPISFSP